LKLLFTFKSKNIDMIVKCIKGHEGVLNEGDIYTVVAETSKGNYILAEAEVPEGFTSFHKDRFEIISTIGWEDAWDGEMEEAFWAEQPPTELNA
jgi:hypothetical protein